MPTIYGTLNPPAAANYAGSAQVGIEGDPITGADGDIFIRNNAANPVMWRFSAERPAVVGPPAYPARPAVWTQIQPPIPLVHDSGSRIDVEDKLGLRPRTTLSDTRGDTAPRGGATNDRLAKVDGRPWALGWRNASAGVVIEAPFTQSTPLRVWDVLHDLGSPWVDVTVVSPGETDPSAPQTILVPEVDFLNDATCRLTFAEDVVGTAIVRR